MFLLYCFIPDVLKKYLQGIHTRLVFEITVI